MELPLRLLVSAIVVGVTAPAVVSGLSAVETAQASERAAAAVDALVRAAQDFYLAGGGAQAIPVDLGGGVTVRVESVTIGDAPGGPRATTAAYTLSGQPPVFLRTDPPVPMAGDAGPLRLGAGAHVVRVSFEGQGPVRLAVVG
jgi:type II secretory pathway pseudopilin PulG